MSKEKSPLPEFVMQNFWESFRRIFKVDVTTIDRKEAQKMVQSKLNEVSFKKLNKDKQTSIKRADTMLKSSKYDILSEVKERKAREQKFSVKTYSKKGKSIRAYRKGYNKWDKDKESVVVQYKDKPPSYIAYRINSRFGTSFTASGVATKKSRLFKVKK